VLKKRQISLKQNLVLLLEPLTLKPIKVEDNLIMYLHQLQSCQHKNKSFFFQKLPKELEDFKSNLF
jgi:hypothetical protein